MTLNELANKHGTDKGDGNYDKHNYAHVYESLIDIIPPTPEREFKLLEVGIWDPRNEGASIRMWREFLPTAEIHGMDINPGCLVLQDECKISVHIVDQGNTSTLRQAMEKIGEVDFVCDDGSHVLQHIKNTFDVIWPFVKKGGFYAIEDLHAWQAQPKNDLVPFVQERGGTDVMWPSEKLFIIRK